MEPASDKKNVKTSEGTKRTREEFALANKIVSLFYNRFKQIIGYKWERKRLMSLKKLVLSIIRSAPASLTGERSFQDGDISMLKSFLLSPNVSPARLFGVEVKAEIDPSKEIRLTIAPFKPNVAFSAPKHTALAQVKFYVLSFDLSNFSSKGKAILAFSAAPDKENQEELGFNLPLNDLEKQLILIIHYISFKRKTESGFSTISNKRFMAAEIILAGYIENGKLVEYQKEEPSVKIQKSEEPGIWEDLE